MCQSYSSVDPGEVLMNECTRPYAIYVNLETFPYTMDMIELFKLTFELKLTDDKERGCNLAVIVLWTIYH